MATKPTGASTTTSATGHNLFLRYGFTNYWAAESSPLGNVIGAGTRDRLLNHNAIIGVVHNFGRGS